MWKTKCVHIHTDLTDLDLKRKIDQHCIDGWEPWSATSGGNTWIVLFKRREYPGIEPTDST